MIAILKPTDPPKCQANLIHRRFYQDLEITILKYLMEVVVEPLLIHNRLALNLRRTMQHKFYIQHKAIEDSIETRKPLGYPPLTWLPMARFLIKYYHKNSII